MQIFDVFPVFRNPGTRRLIRLACFAALDDDLQRLDHATHLFAGNTQTPEGEPVEIVVVAMHDASGKSIAGFRMMSGQGSFEIRAERMPTWLFAFYDLNHDLIFQDDETYTWANAGKAIDPASQATDGIQLVFHPQDAQRPAKPKHLVDEPLEDKFGNYVKLSVGTVTSLDSPLFSADQSEKGLWEPFKFTEDGGAGVHFLQPYDPDKIPVLFVHGINGTPLNFEHLIRNLDDSRYQAWVVSYPSGMRLSWVARGIYQVMQVLHVQYEFDDLHIVAHSMGGLVSKGTPQYLCGQSFLRLHPHLHNPVDTVEWCCFGRKRHQVVTDCCTGLVGPRTD